MRSLNTKTIVLRTQYEKKISISEPDKAEESHKPLKKPKSTDKPIDYDWRDPSKPRNPEDDVIVDGWRRLADGTFEKVDEVNGG